MLPQLSPEEKRVLGAMIEKDMATPEYYPLSLNALVNACNQKTNRDPISNYSEETVQATLDTLRGRQLSVVTHGSGRVPKYGHRASETLGLGNRELALVCVLLLRGAQTLNELKSRTERLYEFDSESAVEICLQSMAAREMVVMIPKQTGMREPRWMHLFSGPVDINAPVEESVARQDSLADRVSKLESELAELRQEFAEFRRQLE
jgi:uncharacterized protein YceH (UPF0502 family)